jgi:hypothetical protein
MTGSHAVQSVYFLNMFKNPAPRARSAPSSFDVVCGPARALVSLVSLLSIIWHSVITISNLSWLLLLFISLLPKCWTSTCSGKVRVDCSIVQPL